MMIVSVAELLGGEDRILDAEAHVVFGDRVGDAKGGRDEGEIKVTFLQGVFCVFESVGAGAGDL